MKIAVTGASGLIGKAFCTWATDKGHEVLRMLRTPEREGDFEWHAASPVENLTPFLDVDCFVHLAGAPIASKRWNASLKQAIYDSRVNGTKNIASLIERLPRKPALIQASAIGYYGHTDGAAWTENSPAGTSFLSTVCVDWEQAGARVTSLGCRHVAVRVGIVLSANGGALEKMLPVFKLGLGGWLGSGCQTMSWVALEDIVRIFAYCVENPVHGAVNGVAPHPVSNKEFSKSLGATLNRPVLFPVPSFALKIALGEMADELLLKDLKVVPEKLGALDFQFLHPRLPSALQAAVHRS